MKKLFLISIALIALNGCATVNETYTADGRKAYALNCSGTARGWDKCLKSAGEICGAKGYQVLDKTGEGMAVASGSSSGFFATQTQERSMLIACKK